MDEVRGGGTGPLWALYGDEAMDGEDPGCARGVVMSDVLD